MKLSNVFCREQNFIKLNGKIIGEIKGDKFIKNVVRQQHFFRKFSSWGLEVSVLRYLLKNNVQIVQLDVKDEKSKFIHLTIWRDKGRKEQFKPFGMQYFCPESFFHNDEQSARNNKSLILF